MPAANLNGSPKHPALRSEAPQPHTHRNGLLAGTALNVCFTCEQEVSAEKFVEIQAKDRARTAELTEQITARIMQKRDAEIGQIEKNADARIAKANADAAKREAAIRKEAASMAAAATKALTASFETKLKERLEAQTERAAQETDRRVNAATEKHVKENLTLHAMVQELTRKLEKKTANELGEAGEVDLFDLLMTEFPTDQINRVGRGVNGPDILHRVFSGGSFTGRQIVYESKNHKDFQSKWLTKARKDQADYQADHIVLVSTAFPPGKSQMMVENGVIVCSPARAAAIAHMLRRAVLHTHALGLSNADRDEKTAQLYDLLTSERAGERWERMSAATTGLLDIERSDAAHQEKTRNKRLSHVRAIVAVHDEFTGDIDCIVRGEPEDLL